MPRKRNNLSSTINNQVNKVAQKGNEKSPENNLKDMEDCDLNDRIQNCNSEKALGDTRNFQKGSSMSSGISINLGIKVVLY